MNEEGVNTTDITRTSSADSNVYVGGSTSESPETSDQTAGYNFLAQSNTVLSLMRGCIKRIVEEKRVWWHTNFSVKHQKTCPKGLDFTIMSYNILSQKLLEDHRDMYTHCKAHCLKWKYRSRNLLQEISSHNSDIVCLQELEEQQYHEIFKPHLQTLGYTSLYKKKTHDKLDGCAMFIKESKFSMESYIAVEYYRRNLKVLDRDNVGLIAMLKPKHEDLSGTKLCVATTHLLFNPRRGDVKLSQLRVLLAEVERLAFKTSKNNVDTYHPIILCGDMNSEPFSPLYDFVVGGAIHYSNMTSAGVSGQKKNSYSGENMSSETMSLSNIGINVHTKYEKKPSTSYSPCAQIYVSDMQCAMTGVGSSPLQIRMPLFPTPGCSTSHSGVSVYPTPATISKTLVRDPHVGSGFFYHPLNFLSTYKHFRKHASNVAAKEITTQNQNSKCTVDYIFYNVKRKNSYKMAGKYQHKDIVEGQLKHMGCFGLLYSYDFDDIYGLPNAYLSSDHLCLISRFLLTS